MKQNLTDDDEDDKPLVSVCWFYPAISVIL